MRDPNRLDRFYNELCRIHKEKFPDWRFMQLICNLQRDLGSDLFYTEEEKMLKYIKKYVGELDGCDDSKM